MRRMNKNILLSLLLLLTTSAQAYPNYYCAKNFKTVTVGDAQETVRAACGEPSTTVTKQIPVQTSLNVVQWVYTLGLLSINGVQLNLPSLSVTFSNNIVIEIDKNNIPITAGGYCNINGVINVGDNLNNVLAKCGRPNFINQRQSLQTTSKSVIEWTITLVLTSRKSCLTLKMAL